MALKKFLMIGVVTGLLVACGDDASDKSPVQVAEESSSSVDEVLSSSVNVEESSSSFESEGLSSSVENGASSSSEKSTESSSGKNTEPAEVSSCSVAEVSSSSTTVEPSSSSVKVQESSSSVKVEESSSSAKTDVSSSSEKPAESSSSEKIEESSSSQQNTFVDSSYYNAEENTLTDFRDGQIYKTVSIGNQIWMAQDLKIKEYGKKTIKSYCYEDNPQNCDTIGRLYVRSAAFDSIGIFGISGKGCGNKETTCSVKKPVRGICPKNWHIADSLEWVHLFNAIDKNKLNLMATYGWDESCYENPMNGTYGFNALPGYRGSDGKYSKWASDFWVGEGNVRSFSLSCYWEPALPIIRYATPKSALSVRCLKDSE